VQPSRSASLSLRLLLALAMVTWGGAWPAGKVASTAAPPEVTILWRFILTTAAFLPVFLAMRRAAPQAVRFRSMPARAWAYTVATAAGMVLYNLLFLFGVRRGLAGVGGIVTPMVGALITGLATMALRRRRPASSMVAGLVLGLAGGLVILRVWRFSAGELLGSGNLYFLAAAATW
jgi:drug/metabolite transporter (DMT)-like permease